MAGDIQHSARRYFTPIKNKLIQKLLVTNVQIPIGIMADRLPIMHTKDFVIFEFFSNLSLIKPPIIVDRNPHPATMKAL
jgi:hypothetical protein